MYNDSNKHSTQCTGIRMYPVLYRVRSLDFKPSPSNRYNLIRLCCDLRLTLMAGNSIVQRRNFTNIKTA